LALRRTDILQTLFTINGLCLRAFGFAFIALIAPTLPALRPFTSPRRTAFILRHHVKY
jgi:hypothetical protein